MYHPRFSGDHYEMGRKMGAIFQRNNARFPIKLDSFQIKHCRQCKAILGKHFPEVMEEIQCVTDTIGYDNDVFISWMMCMGSCLDIHNSDCTEVRGCTAFSFTKNDQVYHGRDNDLPPFFEKYPIPGKK